MKTIIRVLFYKQPINYDRVYFWNYLIYRENGKHIFKSRYCSIVNAGLPINAGNVLSVCVDMTLALLVDKYPDSLN